METKDFNFTLSDFKILISLASFKRNDTLVGSNPLKAVTIKELIEQTKLSRVKINSSLKKFQECGYVGLGFKNGNSKTYFTTDEGYELIKTLKEVKSIEEIKEGEF